MLLNRQSVLLNGGCNFRAGDIVVIDGPPHLTVTTANAPDPVIAIAGAGAGFAISVAGFDCGTSLTSEALGTMADGRPIVMLIVATCVSELGDGAFYRIDYTVAERRE